MKKKIGRQQSSVKDGEQRRFESIVRRQEEERERKRLISEALEARNGGGTGKRIKFDDSDADEEQEEQKLEPEEQYYQNDPSTSYNGGDDPRFQMGQHFFIGEDEQFDADGSNHQHKNGIKKNTKLPHPPFCRYDPANPEHVKWVRSLKKENNQKEENAEEQPKVGQKNVISNGTKTAKMRSKSVVDPGFAEELRQKLKAENSLSKSQQQFSFLASFGKAPMEGEREQEDKTESDVGKFKKNKSENGLKDDEEVRQEEDKNPPRSISLYKPPTDDGTHRPFFFVDEHSPEIRTAVASFRRHRTEEAMRKDWEKQREIIVKFYKHARKSALRYLRKNEGMIKGKKQQQKGEEETAAEKGSKQINENEKDESTEKRRKGKNKTKNTNK